MIPGAALLHENFHHIVQDIALLNSLGVRLILVHGARPQIEARLQESSLMSSFHNNLRITENHHLDKITQAVASARVQIEAALSTGLPNSPMHLADIKLVSGNFVVAKPWGVVDGVDLQHTGKVRKINGKHLSSSLEQGAVVVVSPTGYSPTGEVFNLSFADVARKVAIDINADKIIAFTSEDGYRNSDDELVRALSLADCRQELQKLKINDDKSQSLQACYDACMQGVSRGHMISYQQDGALLTELFTRDGSGTLVHRDSYETIRAATIDDVGGIIELIKPLEEKGALVRRSRELLEAEIEQFVVSDKDGTITACAALYGYEGDMAELSCVATHKDYQGAGRAAQILEHIEKRAKAQGITKLFVLTTRTAHWFIEQGFSKANLNQLPVSKQSLYNYQRNSLMFTKTL